MISFNDRDEFNRKNIAEKLIALFASDIGISPAVIDGRWGSGKTEFCHKLIQLNEEKQTNLSFLYVNSYQYDHSDDPLLMLISKVSSIVTHEDKKRDLAKAAIPVAKVLGKVTGKAAVSWLLRSSADDIGKELVDAVESEGEGLVEKGIAKIFEDFEKIDENINLYKSALKRAVSDKKIVIVVDELDRCRPSFALSLLEKIKHVFDVEGVQFLFATNLNQLEAVVKKMYGYEIDAHSYLSKFFNYTIKLPEEYVSNRHEFNQNSFDLFWSLIERLPEMKRNASRSSAIANFFRFLFKKDQRSLRDAEKFYQKVRILNALKEECSIQEDTHWMYLALTLLGTYIYTFHAQLTEKILLKKLKRGDIELFFEMDVGVLTKEEHNFVKIILAFFMLDNPLDDQGLTANQVRYWEGRISECFNGTMHSPMRGAYLAVLQKIIRTIQLL